MSIHDYYTRTVAELAESNRRVIQVENELHRAQAEAISLHVLNTALLRATKFSQRTYLVQTPYHGIKVYPGAKPVDSTTIAASISPTGKLRVGR